ncbi:hypothetical protein AMTRI_Chr08g161000 [Amborella trichopoda]
MSLIPRVFAQRFNVYDPFSLDIWDTPSSSSSLIPHDSATSSFLHGRSMMWAAMEKGVLTVTVPKVEAQKPNVTSIEISS